MVSATANWLPCSICAWRPLELFSAARSKRSGRSTSNDMVKNNEIDVARWVDDRLAELSPPPDWQADSIRGLDCLRNQRHAERVRGRRWAWTMSGAVVTCSFVLALPATRVFAGRCVNACVSFWQ